MSKEETELTRRAAEQYASYLYGPEARIMAIDEEGTEFLRISDYRPVGAGWAARVDTSRGVASITVIRDGTGWHVIETQKPRVEA